MKRTFFDLNSSFITALARQMGCCEVKQNELLLQIQNPYAGQVVIRNGLPVSEQEGHCCGYKSIQSIAQRNGGLCSFKAENGVFALRLAFPLPANFGNQDTNNAQMTTSKE